MLKILIRVSIDEKKMNWPKKTLGALPQGCKVKSDFSVYFSIEKSNPKNVFCIINLDY
jgi:hypothetical protein